MKIAFDEEATSSQVDMLRKTLLQLRHPASVMQTFAFTHSHVLLQPQLHAKTKEKTASLKYVTQCSFLFFLQPSLIRGLATPWTYFLHLSLFSVILIDSSTESPVQVLMLSIQAMRGLPRLHVPGIVSCIISFSLFPHGLTIVC